MLRWSNNLHQIPLTTLTLDPGVSKIHHALVLTINSFRERTPSHAQSSPSSHTTHCASGDTATCYNKNVKSYSPAKRFKEYNVRLCVCVVVNLCECFCDVSCVFMSVCELVQTNAQTQENREANADTTVTTTRVKRKKVQSTKHKTQNTTKRQKQKHHGRWLVLVVVFPQRVHVILTAHILWIITTTTRNYTHCGT